MDSIQVNPIRVGVSTQAIALRPTITHNETQGIFRHPIAQVQNSHVNVGVRVKDIELYTAVCANEHLSNLSFKNKHTQQEDRLHSVGMAATAIYNLYPCSTEKGKASTLCTDWPKNSFTGMKHDDVIYKQAHAFISEFIGSKAPIDSTIYAQALHIGYTCKTDRHDSVMIGHFAATWKIRMGLAKKN